MWTCGLLYSLTCVVLITKSAKVDPLTSNGEFKVYSKSAGYSGDNVCIIKINGGGNICKNKRGHNVVVVDPISLEYDSVSFDTWGDSTAPKRMVKYLQEVKRDSLIVMALKDATYQGYWNPKQISFVDSYGSETLHNTFHDAVVEDEGCPVAVGRRAWTLVTQQRPWVNKRERLMPNWVTCDYKESKYNSAVIDKIVNVTIPCPISEEIDYCSDELSVSSYKNVKKYVNMYNFTACLKDNDCKIVTTCNPLNTPRVDTEINYCGWDGKFTNFKCPSCENIFGLDKKISSEEVYVWNGLSNTVKFEIKTIVEPPEDSKFLIKYNEQPYQRYWPYYDRLEQQYPNGDYNVKLSSSANLLVNKKGRTYTVALRLQNVSLSNDKDTFRLKVVDEKNIILHDYTKVIRVRDICENCGSDRGCNRIVEEPYYECCEENLYGDDCRINLQKLPNSEVFYAYPSLPHDSLFKNANFTHIQNMKLKFSGLENQNIAGKDFYTMKNTSIEFTVKFLNRANSRSSTIVVKTMPVNYIVKYDTEYKKIWGCNEENNAPLKFYSDDLENSLTTENEEGDIPIGSLVCRVIFSANKRR